MIVKGDYEFISMAIYGDVVSDILTTPEAYNPRPLPSITTSPLPPALDPANMRDPTQLARELLKSMPDCPDLEQIGRAHV